MMWCDGHMCLALQRAVNLQSVLGTDGRFYRSQQQRLGDAHVFAVLSRFVPDCVLDQFERRQWLASVAPELATVSQAHRVDVVERMLHVAIGSRRKVIVWTRSLPAVGTGKQQVINLPAVAAAGLQSGGDCLFTDYDLVRAGNKEASVANLPPQQ